MGKKDALTRLKIRLDLLQWPAIYVFKFIAPIDKINEVLGLFEKEDTETRVSKFGNYISVTVKPFMYNSDKVIDKYHQAFRIDGLMAL